MSEYEPKPDPALVREANRILMNAPRKATPAHERHSPLAVPLSNEIPTKPQILDALGSNATLSKITTTLNKYVDELHKRAIEGSMSAKDVTSLTNLVRAHATLRQTQLAEDQFARSAQSLASDADVANLLIEAVKAGGPAAAAALRAALDEIEGPSDASAGSASKAFKP